MYEYSGDEAINTLMMYGNSRPNDDGTELDIVDDIGRLFITRYSP